MPVGLGSHPLSVSMPWRAFGDSEEPCVFVCCALSVAVSMPWRAFGDSETCRFISVLTTLRRFQCPGGRSGIRSQPGAPGGMDLRPVSMPWRAFGDSEVRIIFCENQTYLSFNALAGVRGFGASPARTPTPRSSSRFNALAGVRGFGASRKGLVEALQAVSMPWRAFGDSEQRSRLSVTRSHTRFNALAGVRGFGVGRWAAFANRLPTQFQCPGGRSGIRSQQRVAPAAQVIDRFNALAGVRGFGG